VVLRLVVELSKLSRQAVVYLAQSFAELGAFPGGDDRGTPVDVQNLLDFLGFFSSSKMTSTTETRPSYLSS